MDTLRVIQWTTGKVGQLALRAILDDPRLRLAGVYAYSDAKAGTVKISLKLRYQACNDRLCQAPAALEVPLAVTIGKRESNDRILK